MLSWEAELGPAHAKSLQTRSAEDTKTAEELYNKEEDAATK